MKIIKKLWLLVLALLIYVLAQQSNSATGQGFQNDVAMTVETAYKQQLSDQQIHGKGVVLKVLPDDTKGLRHQKIILQTRPGRTVLVAHNIDMAPRLVNIQRGDVVEFYGEYEWTERGGVIHWTHMDSSGKHIDGWLKHNDRIYQ
jgi:hypothetical protein